MQTPRPMTLARLRELLDAYGAKPERWPAAERAVAYGFIATSAEGRRHRDAARQLDDLLDLAPEADATSTLLDHILTVAPAARTATIARHAAPLSAVRRPSSTATRTTSSRRPPGVWRVGRWALLPFAAAAASVIWIAQMSAPTAPASNDLAVAEIGVYESPTDVLLTTPGFGTLDSIPTFGCETSGLGCLDTPPVDTQSASTPETYV